MARYLVSGDEKMITDSIVKQYVCRKYWDADLSHASYANVLRPASKDEEGSVDDGFPHVFDHLLTTLDASDGEVIEITIRKTGVINNPDKVWKLVEPHTYKLVNRETEQ